MIDFYSNPNSKERDVNDEEWYGMSDHRFDKRLYKKAPPETEPKN